MLASHIFSLCKSSQEIGAATIIFPPNHRVTYGMKMVVRCMGLHGHQYEHVIQGHSLNVPTSY